MTCKVDDIFCFRIDFLISAGLCPNHILNVRHHYGCIKKQSKLLTDSIGHTVYSRIWCKREKKENSQVQKCVETPCPSCCVLQLLRWWAFAAYQFETDSVYCWHGDMSDRSKKPKGTACTPRTMIFNYPDAMRTQTISPSLFSLELLKRQKSMSPLLRTYLSLCCCMLVSLTFTT